MLAALGAVLQVAAAAAVSDISNRDGDVTRTFMILRIIIIEVAAGTFGLIGGERPDDYLVIGGMAVCAA